MVRRENEQVVSRCNCNGVFLWMVAGMQDLLVEVHIVGVYMRWAKTSCSGLVHSREFSGLERRLVCL